MNKKDFIEWQSHMGFNDSETSRQLSITRKTVAKYKHDGAPLVVALACTALANRLAPWRPPSREWPWHEKGIVLASPDRPEDHQTGTVAELVKLVREGEGKWPDSWQPQAHISFGHANDPANTLSLEEIEQAYSSPDFPLTRKPIA